MPLNAILAVDFQGLIGLNGEIPWRLPKDMKWFRDHTMGHSVIMGRKTWESLPDRFRPLPGRDNYVMTRDQSWSGEGCTALRDTDAVVELLESNPEREFFIIGGAEVYGAFAGVYDKVFLTIVMHTFAIAPDDEAVNIGPITQIVRGLTVETQAMHEPDDRHDFPFLHLTYVEPHLVQSPNREMAQVISEVVKVDG
jgi:dihydrofolate reductase